MTGFNHIFGIIGRRVMEYADCPFAWAYSLPPSCDMLRTLNSAWKRITKVVAALEVGNAILADLDDYDIDGVSLTLSRETIDMMRAAGRRLMDLQAWTPHPAAPGTHDFLDIILHAVDQEALHNTAAHRTSP